MRSTKHSSVLAATCLVGAIAASPAGAAQREFADHMRDLRRARDNYDFGKALAAKVLENKKGGTVCIQSGAPASENLKARVQGIRDALGGGTKDKPIARLTGQNGWTEPAGCPVYNNDDITLAAQQVRDVMTNNPNLDALVAVGGWPNMRLRPIPRPWNR